MSILPPIFFKHQGISRCLLLLEFPNPNCIAMNSSPIPERYRFSMTCFFSSETVFMSDKIICEAVDFLVYRFAPLWFPVPAFSCHFGLFVESDSELPTDNKLTIKSSMLTIKLRIFLSLKEMQSKASDQQKAYKFKGQYLEWVVD